MTEIRRNVVYSFIEKYSGFFISFGTIVVLSRILTPAQTGLYSIAAALINIAQVLRECGAYVYLLQERDLTREKIGSVAGVSLLVGSVMTLLFVLAAPAIAAFYEDASLAPLIIILSGNFVVVAYGAIGHGLMVRDALFRANMLVYTIGNIVNAAVSIGLALLGFGAACLAWASLASVVVTLIGNFIVLRGRAFARPNFIHWRAILHFGVFSSASGVLNAVGTRAPDLLIGRIISLEGAGLFSRGGGIVTTLRDLITGVVQPVAVSLFAKTYRDGADLRASYYDVLGYVAIIAWPAFAMMAVLADPLIGTLFGEKWLASVPVAQILCVSFAVGLTGWLAQTLLGATGGVRENFWIQAVSVPIYLVSIAIGATHGLTAAAGASVVSAIIVSVLSFQILQRKVSLEFAGLSRRVLPAIVAAFSSAAAAYIPLAVLGSSLLTLVAGGCAGVATWLASVYLLRHPVRDEITLILKKVT